LGSTICIKCGSSLVPFSYCELCNEPLNFKCSSCEFITEEKVHVDCVNANSLVKEDKVIDKEEDIGSKTAAENSRKQDTISSNRGVQTDKIEVRERRISENKDHYHYENYPNYGYSDIVGKYLYNFAKLNLDIISTSTSLFSVYYEQYLQYEKAWRSYWRETFRSFKNP
jgi:hypothetical protein